MKAEGKKQKAGSSLRVCLLLSAFCFLIIMAVKKNPHSIVIVAGDRYDSWIDKQFFKQVTVELVSQSASQGLFRCFDARFKFIDKYTSGDGIPPLPMLFYMGFGEDLGQPIFKGILQRAERGDTDTTFRALDVGVKMRQEKKLSITTT